MASSRRYRRPPCALPVIVVMRKRHSMEIAERRQVETINRPCLS
jgi:hypothetical protein